MSLLIIILAVTGLTAVSWTVASLVELVRHDGRGRTRVAPPRSHPADLFEPSHGSPRSTY